MATGQWPTLVDRASRLDGAGRQLYIAEMMSQHNDLWGDVPFIESSEIDAHLFAFRSSVPSGFWRQYNQGVPYAKSTTGKGKVGLGGLEGYSQVDRKLALHTGNPERFCKSEDAAFIEGMGQTMAQTWFYGNVNSNPAQFGGLAMFFNTVNTANAANAVNVLDFGGTGSSNTSLWLECFGDRTLFGLYPRGSKAGLQTIDHGTTRAAYDALGNPFEAFTMYFSHDMGSCPMDWRYIVRGANIDVTVAGLAGPQAPDLFLNMDTMLMLVPHISEGTSGVSDTDAFEDPAPGIRPVFHCNRTLKHWMLAQSLRNKNVLLGMEDFAGKPILKFRGVPIKIVDQLLNTESRVI